MKFLTSQWPVPPKVHPGGGGRKVKMGWEEWERGRGVEQKKKLKKKKVGVTIWWATRPG